MMSTRLPRGVRMLRSVPPCPSRAGRLKPVTSLASIVAVVSPISSAALGPAAAEREGDVVVVDAGDPRDVGGSIRGDGERVCGRVVERVVVAR